MEPKEKFPFVIRGKSQEQVDYEQKQKQYYTKENPDEPEKRKDDIRKMTSDMWSKRKKY